MATCSNGKSKSIGLKKSSGGHGVGPRLGLAVTWTLLDQLTKIAVLKTFTYGESRLVADFFNLMLTYNKGVASSFLAATGGWRCRFFMGPSVMVALFIMWLLKRHSGQKMSCFALALILGDVPGNVTDRVIHGHVVDLLDFYLHNYHWPTFNVADCGTTTDAVLLIVDELWRVCR